MINPYHLVFDGHMVRSLRYPKRCGVARTVLSTGRWQSGETLSGSDAGIIARYLKPCTDGRRSKRRENGQGF